MATAKKPAKKASLENNQGHGGARRGAGRKKGAATKRTREIADKAAAEGITPLEVMLENMRFAHSEAGGILASLLAGPSGTPEDFDALKELLRYRGMAQEAAKDAAPYIHPRLSSIDLKADVSTHEATLDDLA